MNDKVLLTTSFINWIAQSRIHLHVQPIPVILDAATPFGVKTGWSVLHLQWVALRGSVKLHRITHAHGGDAAWSAICSQNNTLNTWRACLVRIVYEFLKGEFKNGKVAGLCYKRI